jgi:serine/threonine-protein kinase
MLPSRYEFRRVLGKGGAAYVILADDTTRQRPVAVKILRPELATAVGESRFHREIEILSALDHPHILPLFDHGAITAHLFYFTMPYVEGPTLREFIEERKRLTLDETIGITQSVAAALDYAHTRGVIHRDIKPANILMADGRTLLADFGIARAMAVEQARQLTASGVTLGTAEYMSPEQIEAVRELDGRCDVYALGCVVYEMLAGEPPFTGLTERAILAKHMREPPKSIKELLPNVPSRVDDAITKALAKVRAQRFRKAGDFAAALSAESTGPLS